MTTDGALLERWIARRDSEAFNEIISRHAAMVYGVCKRVVRNDADAEDLAQSCFLKLACAGSPPRSSVLGWLHAVATRSAIDFLRARGRRQERERAFAEARARERATREAMQEIQEHVDECIAQLPERLREVIVLHFLERKTHEEAAAALGVSRQTVTHRIQKGLERIRGLLTKRGLTASGAALAALFGAAGVEAAPGTLLASLGRLALAGPEPGLVAASPAAFPLLATVGGFLMAKKLLISASAALVLVLLVGFGTFQHLSGPADPAAVVPEPRILEPGKAPAGGAPTAAGRRPAPEASEAAKTVRVVDASRGGLSGIVLDGDGRPVAGARVVLAAGPPGGRQRLFETTSDAAGSFLLEAVEREDAVVWSFKGGVGLGAASGPPAALKVSLEPLSGVSGRIYDKETGKGIAGLSVRLSRSDSTDLPPETASFYSEAWTLFPELGQKRIAVLTAPDGGYEFQDLSPVTHRFAFDPDSSEYVLPGYRLDDSTPDLLLAPGERRSGVNFALQRGGSIAGTVFGPDEKGLPEARVEVLASKAAALKRVLRCDPRGEYRFIGLPLNATYVVGASHPGLPPGESATVALATPDPIEGVDIHLVEGSTVRGRFVDELGQPIAGLDVFLARLSESARRGGGYGKAVTGEDGSFHFEKVAPGKHVLQPFSNLHLAGGSFDFTMPAEGDLSDLEFVLRRKSPGFISGRVLDHSGKPVAGFPVNAQIGMRTVARALSGEDGAFRLEGLGDAGEYTITGYSSEYWSGRRLAVPLYSSEVTLVVMQRGRILGRVIDAGTKRPLEHFEVRAVFIRTEPGGGENRFHLKWTPFDSPTGEFLIERAEPVESEVQAKAEGYVEAKSARFAIPPGGTAEGIVIALSRGAAVSGAVLDAETGEPLPGALVRAHQQDGFQPWLLQEGKASYAPRGVWKLTMSKEDGSFELDGLAPGETIHLVAWKEGYGASVRPGVTVGQGGNALKISLGRAATLIVSARFTPHPGERYELHAYHRDEKP